MLIRCCFAIIVMVNTMYSASNRSFFKFLHAFDTIHHVSLHHLDFYSDHGTFSQLKFWGGYLKISSQPPFVHFIYMCVHFFLVA
jgi:hypothetical protein